MSNVKVSIILPVYNSEKYLEETLKALINQSIKEIEIIIINDGSIDKSGKIGKKYEGIDKRIIYIDNENNGPSAARNIGLSIAQGEYIGFCDSDDIPDLNMYKTLYEYASNSKSDISLCDMYSERSQSSMGLPYNDGHILNRDEIIRDLIPKMIGKETDDDTSMVLWGSVVRCIFKKELIDINNIMFPVDIDFAEDLIFTLKTLSYANSVSIVNKVLYFYRLNTDSLMMSHQKYKQNMFLKRKKLTNYIKGISLQEEIGISYEKNRLVSFRAYVHECVGNACRKSSNRNIIDSHKELKYILHDKDVNNAFKNINCKHFKTRILYTAIKKRQCILLLIYYNIRFYQKRRIN